MSTGEVLLIEDEELQSKLYASLLESTGHALRTTASVKEALDVISERSFALILIDIMMPKIGGITGCVSIREAVGKDVPILFLSVLDDAKTVARGFEAGANGFISKQASLTHVIEEIDAWLSVAPEDLATILS